MSKIADIIKTTSHRPWTLPAEQWQYYQEWNNALFLHWSVATDMIKPLIPPGLEIDTIQGKTWISLVAFTMEKIRPRNLPVLAAVSTFHEINVRAYVLKDNKPGVYFLNIEAQKIVSVLIAKSLSGLPYEKATISRTQKGNTAYFVSENKAKNFHLDVSYETGSEGYAKTDIDKWLTERYCLYLDKGKNIYRYEIHHEEWDVKKVNIKRINLHYQIGALVIGNRRPDLSHFSKGVQVLAWRRHKA